MALISCRECGASMSSAAFWCQACGIPWPGRWPIGGFTLALFLAAVIGYLVYLVRLALP